MLTALKALEASPLAGKIGWEVLLNADEEIGSPGSIGVIKQIAARCDLGLLYEPALPDGTLVSWRKGSGNFSFVVRGKAAHAGREFEKGRNAIVAASRLIDEIANLNTDPEVTYNAGRISGGGPLNVVPDLAIGRVNVRVKTVEQQAEIAARGDLFDDTNTSRRSDFFVGVEQNFPADLSSQRTGFECFKRGEHYNDPTFGIGHAGPIDRTVVKRFAFLERMPNRVHSVHVNAQQDFLARLRPLADVNHLPQLLLDLGTTVVDDRHRLGVDQFDLATERFKLVNQTLLDCRKPFKIERPGVYVAKALDQLQHRGALVVDRFKMLQQVSQFILSRLRLSFSFSSFAEAAENSILN